MIALLLIGILLVCIGVLMEYARSMSPAPSMEASPGAFVALVGLVLSVVSGAVLIWRLFT